MSLKHAALLAALGSFASCAAAQSVGSVSVFKLKVHRQSDASGPALLAPAELPYGFDASVAGEDMDLLAAPTITGPISNPEPGHNGGMMGLDGDEWRYGAPNFIGWGTETESELDALFGAGTYTLSIAGQPVNLLLGPPAYPANAPVLTLSGGAWDGGVYRIDAGSELTVQSSSFPEFNSSGGAAAFLGVFGGDFGTEAFVLSSDGGTGALTLTIPANTLTPGEEYLAESFHSVVTEFRPLGFGLPDSIAAAGYEMLTEAVIAVNSDDPGCLADLAEPTGVLDLADIVAFVDGFTTMNPIADFDDNGLFDLADITAFVSAFVAGCP